MSPGRFSNHEDPHTVPGRFELIVLLVPSLQALTFWLKSEDPYFGINFAEPSKHDCLTAAAKHQRLSPKP